MEFPDVEKAFKHIKNEIHLTKTLYSSELSSRCNSEIFLKLENQQLTGSFKFRGALNKLKVLLQNNPAIKKVVTASTGNHAAAVAYAAWKLNLEKIIFAPASISSAKREELEKQHIDLRLYGTQSVEAEIYARQFANENKLPFVHPYNDIDVMAGQGTIAIELLHQIDQFDTVYVPIGGGGLISGIAYYLKTTYPHIKVIGCQPQNASEMHDSLKKGEIVPPSGKKTIADGTAGGLDPETQTFNFCKKYVDEVVLVSENEIAEAVYLINKLHCMKVEPAAALTIASILKYSSHFTSKRNVAIITGSKVSTNRFNQIVKKFKK
jgi:threonine dehydratase